MATALITLAAATVKTGLALFALGTLRLGKMVRFTPYPVIAGFMGATGWVMATGAVQMTTNIKVSVAKLPLFANPAVTPRLIGLFGFAAFLILLARRVRHPLTVPLTMAAAASGTDIAIQF